MNSSYYVPYGTIEQLIPYQNMLNRGQVSDMVKAYQTGNGFNLTLTKRQQEGGFLGTLLSTLLGSVITPIAKLFGGNGLGNRTPYEHDLSGPYIAPMHLPSNIVTKKMTTSGLGLILI